MTDQTNKLKNDTNNVMKLFNKIFLFLILYLSFFLFSLHLWLDRYFGVVDIEQFLFFFLLGFEGLLDTEDYIIKKFIEICILLPILLIILTYFLFSLSNKINFLHLGKIIHLIKKNFFYISLILLFLSFFSISKLLSFDKWLLNIDNEYDFIAENYIEPKNIKNKKEKRNLVLIYLESFENIFSNKEIFSKNLLTDLDNTKLNGKSFKNFKETAYTNWTIAGIVASQCGLPLKPISIFNTKNKGRHQKHIFGLKTFLPNAKCLGDILKENDYKNIFINAVSLDFVGTGLFFKNHGYNELYGKEEYENLSIPFEPGSWGGSPHDSFLLDFAKNKLLKLKKDNELFNLTILTTDTHAPYGYLDPKCKNDENLNDKEVNLSNTVICTSKNINEFIRFLNKEFPNNLDIVILGDHLFHSTKEIKDKFKNQKRDIFNMFISKSDYELKRDYINHYDLYPTILDFMSFQYPGNRLGLGFSGLKNVDNNEYENYKIKLNENIKNKSKIYKNFYK
mgnify:CR=1 FL=1